MNSSMRIHPIFMGWRDNLIPVNLKLVNGKKDAFPSKWANGEIYSDMQISKKNSIGLRTGNKTANVIDVDTKDLKKLTLSWRNWVEERLELQDTLIVESTNGYHFYISTGDFKLRTTTKTGRFKSPIPFIDFRGEGGLIFISSTVKGVDYKVLGSSQPMEVDKSLILLLPEYEEVEKTQPSDDGDLMLDMLSLSRATMQTDEVRDLFVNLDPNVAYDTWWQWLASAYNLALNKKEVREVCLEWSKKGTTFAQSSFDSKWREFEAGTLGREHGGGTLIDAANKAKTVKVEAEMRDVLEDGVDEEANELFVDGVLSDIETLIENNDTKGAKDFGEDFATGAYISKSLATTLQEHDEVVDDLITAFLKLNKAIPSSKKKGMGEIKLKDAFNSVRNKTIADKVDEIQDKEDALIIEEETKSGNILAKTSDNKFHMCVNDIFEGNISPYVVDDMLFGAGIKNGKKVSAMVKKGFVVVSGVQEKSNYLMFRNFRASIKPRSNKLPWMVIDRNPLFKYLDNFETDKDIVDEFFNGVWGGKFEKIIRLIGLTIKFKETKLNRLMIVAPSNAGKSRAAENLGFQTFNMKRLVAAMEGTKGVGESVVEGLKRSGLLLIDEVNQAIPNTIKEMDKYIRLDQFGSGGTQEIEVLFTIFTSTHGAATRTTSDELSNRVMQITLEPSEMSHTLTNGRLYKENRDKYSRVISDYCKHLLIATIHSDAHKDELLDLQEEFELHGNDDLEEVIYDASVEFINYIKGSATDEKRHTHLKLHHGEYFAQKKKDVYDFFAEKFKTIEGLDHLKYADKLTSHFIGGTKDIRVNKDKKRYHKLILEPMNESEEDKVLSLIDDVVGVEDMFE